MHMVTRAKFKSGVMRESNSRPPAPEAGIIPLDQSPNRAHGGAFYITHALFRDRVAPCANRRVQKERDVLELNQRPIELQSIALPLS